MKTVHPAWGLVWVWVLVGCVSGKGAEAGGGKARGAQHAEPVGVPTDADAEALQAALLDCARLTFAGSEASFQAHLFLNASNQLTGLKMEADGQPPPALMCPADRPLSALVLGTSSGTNWGGAPLRGTHIQVSCGAGLDENTAGCSARQDALVPPETAAASTTPSATPADGSTEPRTASAPTRYSVRRLGTDLPEGTRLNLDSQLVLLDASLRLCLHSRQPAVENGSVDVKVAVSLQDKTRLSTMPMAVRTVTPAGLEAVVADCMRSTTGGYADEGGRRFNVTYTVVASAAEQAPGSYVQEVVVELAGDRLYLNAPTEQRKAIGKRVLGIVHKCFSDIPMERFAPKLGWAPLPGMELRGVVNTAAGHQGELHAVRLVPLEGKDPLPAFLEPHGRCVAEAFPESPPALSAEASWEFSGSVRSIVE